MLNFLGITRHLSTTAGYAKRIGWLLREDVTQSPFPVTDVSFTGTVKTEQGDLPIIIEHGEQENYLELTFPALPIGRWPYAIHAQDTSGEDLRLFSGYIGAMESVTPIEAATVYDVPVMGIAIPIEAGKTIKAQWLSNTAASLAAQQAQQDASRAHTDAEEASNAATTATGAATTATERAKEAEGYAGSAYAAKGAAEQSAESAATSSSNAARDAKAVSDAKAEMEGLASTFPQTVSNGEQAISAAKETAVKAVQDKQTDAVLAVGRASQTAQQNVMGTGTTAVQAVEEAKGAAETAISGLVEKATNAKADAQMAAGSAAQSATNASTAREKAEEALRLANAAAVAAQAALAAMPQVDASGNMTLAGSLTAGRTINANGGVNIPPSVSPLLTGAVSNNELLDYLVDRTMRMSPYVTTVPAIVLKDYIDSSNSTKTPWVNVGLGMIGIKGWSIGLNAEWRVRFNCNLIAETQDGPMYYYDSVAIFSAPTLLNMSYLTSPGAVAQISFVSSDGYCFGVRLVNKDGTAYYEMFYRTGADADEVIVVSEPKPDYVNLYGGATQPQYKMQSLAIFLPRDGNQYAIMKFGPWLMRVPFTVHSGFMLDLMVRQGGKNVNYYGANLSARLASITHICLGYNDQFVPTLNNNAYKS